LDKIQIIEKLLFYINSFSYLLLPLAFLFTKFKKRDSLLVGIYGFILFFPVFYGNKTPQEYQKLFLVSYTFIEYLFLTALIWLNIESKYFKKLIFVLSCSFLIFQIFFFLIGNMSRLDSIPIGIETLLLLSYIFIFFYEQFKNQKTVYIYNHHCFWLSVGILIYLGGSFFFNILANHIDKKQLNDYWQLTLIGEILKNVFFIVAILIFFNNSAKENRNRDMAIPFLDPF